MKTINSIVDKYKKLIYDTADYIWHNPETGYKEFKTSAYLEKTFRELGYDLTLADGITGFYTRIETGRPGPEVLILAELDSIICPAHKDADKETGAVHSCGHHAQCAAFIGIAAALKEPGFIDDLSGNIRLCAVPAEELLEIEYRTKLKKQGIIKYLGGKSEFLSRGYFDGVDIAFMVHTSYRFILMKGSNGCITKNIIYKGLASHAGGYPEKGINALYAATCGINAVNAIRETFVENDKIRFHPIITNGGSMVNAIPNTVSLESYVRGTSYEAIVKENKKVNRALIGGALSIGANVEIIDAPGYSPLINDKNMLLLAKDAFNEVLPNKMLEIDENAISAGSTDMGDLSMIMPVIHPYANGAVGTGHGDNYYIANIDDACVNSAKWQLAMLKLLLKDEAKRAKDIIKEFKPIFKSKEEFLTFQDSLNSSGDRIIYNDNSAEIKL